MAHELFPPPDDGQEHPDIEINRIAVTRFEGGAYKWCPTEFQGDVELKNPGDLFNLFGGGSYELVARDAKGRVSRRSKISLPGDPKPLVPAAPTQPSSALAHSPAVGAPTDLVTLLMSMLANQQQQTVAMFTTMMTVLESKSAATQGQTMEMMKLFAAIATQRPAGTADPNAIADKTMELFVAGMDFMKNTQPAPATVGPKSDMELLVDGIGSVIAAERMAQQPPPPQQQVIPIRRAVSTAPNGTPHHAHPANVPGTSGESSLA